MGRKKKQIQAGKIRRVFHSFRYTECDAFAEYLHEMSLDGWHFKKWQMGLLFEKGEPADITYCVEVFPKGSEMDLKPERQAVEYADYCEVAGWELIDGQRKFCIFRRMDSDAPPIVTEEERFANVRKAEWRQLAFAAVVLWFRPSRETNWWVQVGGGAILVFLMIMVVTAVAFTENGPAENRKALARLPLTQADYCEMKGEPDHAEYSYQKSFFGSRLQGTVIWPNEELEENELSYNVYRSEYAWVLHKIWETETDTMYYKGTKETDPRPWKALGVRRNKNGIATCARYEDALLFLYADTPPAADQIELTLETLNLLKDTN